MTDDVPDLDALHIGALAGVWANRAPERPPRCPVCGIPATLDAAGRYAIAHDPVAHHAAPPDPIPPREPKPSALEHVRRMLGERDDAE